MKKREIKRKRDKEYYLWKKQENPEWSRMRAYSLDIKCKDCGILITNYAIRCQVCVAKRRNLSKKAREKRRESLLQQIKEGRPPALGYKWTDEQRERLRQCQLKIWQNKHRKIKRFRHEGSSYRVWRTRVFERDKYTCQVCGLRNVKYLGRTVYLEAHHIKPYSKFSKLRYDPLNGITLCKDCHNSFDHGEAYAKKKEKPKILEKKSRRSLRKDSSSPWKV